MFDFPLVLPSSTKVRIPEITNRDLYSILKYCIFDDLEGLELFLNTTIFNRISPLNVLDKFYILVFLRTIYLGEEINISTKDAKSVSLSLNILLNKFENIPVIHPEVVIVGDFTVELSLPSKMFYTGSDELYFDLIKSISYKHEKIDISSLNDIDKHKIYQSLPPLFLSNLVSFFNQLNKVVGDITLIDKSSAFDIDQVNVSFLSNQPFHFIKQLYSQDLHSFLEFMYHFVNKVGGGFNDFLNLTITDCKVMFNCHVKEIEKQNEELNKQQSRVK